MGVRNILDAELRGGEARLADGSVAARGRRRTGPAPSRFGPAPSCSATGQHATIRHVAFAGDLVQVFLRSGPIEICAHARPGPELRPGAEIKWHVPPEACLVLKE